MNTIRFTVPLPPGALRSNSRAHWAAKKKAADAYSLYVIVSDWPRQGGGTPEQMGCPWKQAKVTYTWRYAGVRPDHSNLGGNTKHLQDIICMAPRNTDARYKRWHLGLVEDDAGITAEYRLEKVAHRHQEEVMIEIRRLA